MRWWPALVILLLSVTAAYSFVPTPIILLHRAVGSSSPSLTIDSVNLSPTSFTVGSFGTVGTLSSVVSSGSPTISYTITSSGVDHSGITCSDYSSDGFSISGTSLNYINSTPAQNYPEFCITASASSYQPLTQSFTLVGNSSGAIACDYGPNYTGASVPPSASAAGFTRCAANFDFTNTANFVNAGNGGATLNFSNLSTWFNCFGAADTAAMMWSYPTHSPPSAPCDSSHYNMVTDSGVQVLRATWNTSDGIATVNTQSETFNGAGPAYYGFTVPNAFYIEVVWRVDTSNICNPSPPPPNFSGCLVWGPFQYAANGNPNAFVEVDYDEVYSSNAPEGLGPNWGEWGAGCSPCGYPGPPKPTYDPTHYHTYGLRITSDGSSTLGACSYFDTNIVSGLPLSDSNGACVTANPINNVYNSRDGMIPVWGPNPNDVPNITAGFNMYVMRETLWECPTWQSLSEHNNAYSGSQCNGTVNPSQ